MANVVMLPGWQQILDGAIDNDMRRVGGNVKDRAEQLCPVDTGFLRSTIFHRTEGTTQDIGATAPYAEEVELGTAPHIIRASPGGALVSSLGAVFGVEVNHPGTRAHSFLRRAAWEVVGLG